MTERSDRRIAEAFFGEGIQPALERVDLAGGQYLFRTGEPGDAMYVVVAGRVRVLRSEGETAVPLSELGEGQPVGELAVLTGQPRQADVVAVRDTTLYRLDRTEFNRVLDAEPAAMRRTLAVLARRINKPPIVGRNALEPTNIAIVPAGHQSPHIEFAEHLCEFLAGYTSVVRIDRASVAAALGDDAADADSRSADAGVLLEHLRSAEQDHRFVVYVADPHTSAWSRRTLRQADIVLTVGSADQRGAGSTSLTDVEHELFASERPNLAPVHMVLLHDRDDRTPTGTSRWLTNRTVAMVHHVHLGRRSHLARLARFIIGRPVGLVLSGGSTRALAHIGVLRALREANIPVDVVIGTSAGALIGGQFASGWDDRMLESENQRIFGRARRMLDLTIPTTSIIGARTFGRTLRDIFGGRCFEDLWIQFMCTTTDMTTPELRVHRRGELHKAVRASCSLPMLMPPVVDNGHLLADGGMMNNMPVDELLDATAVGSLIVVNVTNPFYDADEAYTYEASLPFWRVLNGRFNPFTAPLVAPSIMNVLLRALELGTKSLEASQAAKADVYVRPDVGDVPYTDASRLAEIVQAGRSAAVAELASWTPEIPFR